MQPLHVAYAFDVHSRQSLQVLEARVSLLSLSLRCARPTHVFGVFLLNMLNLSPAVTLALYPAAPRFLVYSSRSHVSDFRCLQRSRALTLQCFLVLLALDLGQSSIRNSVFLLV